MRALLDGWIHIHPLHELQHEMDLIYYEGPFLSLFRNSANEPYLYYWCDSDEEFNRWLVVRIPQDQLASYLGRRLALQNLILNPSDNLVYVADVDDELEISRVTVLRPRDVPAAYIPDAGAYYNSEPRNINIDLPGLAGRLNSNLLNVHLRRGEGVELGSASMSTLGAVLYRAGELTESIAVAKFAGNSPTGRVTRKEARAYGTFQYLTEKAASFSAILRPLITQESLPGFADRSAEVVEDVIRLLEAGRDYDTMRKLAVEYGEEVVQNLGKLAEEIASRGLDIDVNWAMIGSRNLDHARATAESAAAIVDNIHKLELEGAETLKLLGRFTALDIAKRTYTFKAGNEQSSGRIDVRSDYPITKLSFELKYQVEINRRIQSVMRRKKPRIIDMLYSIAETDFFEI